MRPDSTRLEWIKLLIVGFCRARRFVNIQHQVAVVTVADAVDWVRGVCACEAWGRPARHR